MERKALSLELKDLDTGKRTAVIAHAVYNNIDRVKDISSKGMFAKSWRENKSIDFLFNHADGDVIGNVKDVYEDESKAYTVVGFGNWTLGNDVLEMAEAKVLKGASFGYETIQKEFKTVGSQRVRVLKEVKHFETSLLTVLPANPLAGIITLTKALEEKQLTADEKATLMAIVQNDQLTLERLVQLSAIADISDDLYTWVAWNISRRAELLGSIRAELRYSASQARQLKQHIDVMERFCRESKASDECIKSVLNDIQDSKMILSQYDTALTQVAPEPGASRNDSFHKQLLLLNAKMS